MDSGVNPLMVKLIYVNLSLYRNTITTAVTDRFKQGVLYPVTAELARGR